MLDRDLGKVEERPEMSDAMASLHVENRSELVIRLDLAKVPTQSEAERLLKAFITQGLETIEFHYHSDRDCKADAKTEIDSRIGQYQEGDVPAALRELSDVVDGMPNSSSLILYNLRDALAKAPVHYCLWHELRGILCDLERKWA